MKAKHIKSFVLASGFLLCLLCAELAVAATDIGQMLVNLSKSFGALWRLVTGSAYVIGVALIMRALYHLKVYGELRTMMSSQHAGLKEPGMLILVGAVLIFIETGFQLVNNTFFGEPNILAYADWQGAANLKNHEVMTAVLGVMQIVGIVAFVRGWYILTKAVQQGGQASFGQGLTHIVGGLFAINIIATANMFSNTFGISFS